MSSDLKTTMRNAIIWNALDKVSTQIISVVVGITLARLLNVSDFGLLAMLSIFIAVANTCADSGFSSALVRKEKPTEKDYNTVFYFNLIVSVLFYVAAFFSAPAIAHFFGQPILVPMSRILFIVFIINAFGLIQNARLVKEIQFRKITVINLCSLVFSGALTLICALNGFGVWSLVIQIISLNLAKTILLWIVGKWQPKAVFSKESFKELFAFSSNLMVANVINAIFLNIYSSLIGKIYSVKEAGYYNQASKWADMGISTLYGTIQNATYPIFSTIQNDKERLIRSYRKTIRLTAFITLPALIGLTLVSRPFVIFFLSAKWEPSIIFLQLLSVAGIFTVFTAINGNFIKIAGASGLVLKIEIVKTILVALALAFTWHLSITNIVIGQVIVRIVVYLLNIIATGYCTGYAWYKQLWDVVPYLAISLVMATAAWPISLFIHNIPLLLLSQIAFCILFYYAVNRILHSVILNDILTSFSRSGNQQ